MCDSWGLGGRGNIYEMNIKPKVIHFIAILLCVIVAMENVTFPPLTF